MSTNHVDILFLICACDSDKQDGQYWDVELAPCCITLKETHFPASIYLPHTAQDWDAA